MKKFLKIGLHILFWIAIPSLILYFNWAGQDTTHLPGTLKPESKTIWEIIRSNLDLTIISLISSIPIFYLSLRLLTPKLLFKWNLLKFSLFVISFIACYYFVFFFTILVFPLMYFFGTSLAIKVLGPIVWLSGLGGTMFAFIEKSKKDRLDKEILSKKNVQLELDLLKSSISPHFLFNTLNNIDILIGKEPNKASDYLKKLSGILRFLFSNYKDEMIPLNKELEFIDQYVSLQKLRTTNSDFVSLQKSGKIENWEIPPMLFLPFLENAFKYSTNKMISNAIEIKIDAEDEGLHFLCRNNISTIKNEIQTHGVGIKTMKQRLDLIYKNNYKLDIIDENDFFTVNLNISR